MVSCKHWKNGHCKDCRKNCPIKKKLGQMAAKKAAQKQKVHKAAHKTVGKVALAMQPAFPLVHDELQKHLVHGRRVQAWALHLFAALRAVHGLAAPWEEILGLAAYLHDIGWVRGQKKHHKHSQSMILENAVLPLASEIRPLVALVARYHRKAKPSLKHKAFAALGSAERNAVCVLASLLRIADALEYSHNAALAGITACVQGQGLVVTAEYTKDASAEVARVHKKSALFTALFGMPVQVHCAPRAC